MVGSKLSTQLAALARFAARLHACCVPWYAIGYLSHAFTDHMFTGETKHVIQGILYKGGMFTQRSRRDKPLEKIEAFLQSIWWPASVSRPPDGVSHAKALIVDVCRI